MKEIKIIVSLIGIAFLLNCSGSDDGEGTPSGVTPDPASLVFPSENATCTSGTFISSTENEIDFEWNTAKNAVSYIVNITDLKTNTTSKVSSRETTVKIKLLQDNSYTWSVTAIGSGDAETSTSPVWEFYSPAEGVVNYAPFPAEISTPKNLDVLTGLSKTIEWIGADEDNDITSYDVFLGTTNPPVDVLGNTTSTTIASGSLTAATTYYIQIVTNDAFGNKTKSAVTAFSTP
ncbi:phage tail protein [Aquimarina algiphila]|uniref:hypothetical protein n=1 Tax=Aquimarina algiphila TaxID=2047982 RepID=UPI00232E5C42|nr:hypothetical protein [Aquimarina algiphila]